MSSEKTKNESSSVNALPKNESIEKENMYKETGYENFNTEFQNHSQKNSHQEVCSKKLVNIMNTNFDAVCKVKENKLQYSVTRNLKQLYFPSKNVNSQALASLSSKGEQTGKVFEKDMDVKQREKGKDNMLKTEEDNYKTVAKTIIKYPSTYGRGFITSDNVSVNRNLKHHHSWSKSYSSRSRSRSSQSSESKYKSHKSSDYYSYKKNISSSRSSDRSRSRSPSQSSESKYKSCKSSDYYSYKKNISSSRSSSESSSENDSHYNYKTSQSSPRYYHSSPCSKYSSSYESHSSRYSRRYEKNNYGRHRKSENIQAIMERRVVYVGRLPDDITRNRLYDYFEKFGNILDINIIRKNDNSIIYSFLTFEYTCDAVKAIEDASQDPILSNFAVDFGGRRQFCREVYRDLDGATYKASKLNVDRNY
ncbi:peroxisome proliferator-activated receptor gamma coactivator 1-alpha-like [Centruroides sculpturatus]|uniref:peroxisome proliferator-activated receptor gamma coactivator 1-alpha-like n=1 Tax=Centruroides sculpturatus TaxID=218467 RepID=UPI000C6E5378|nr:peroxisome proliferator-activated receptor gamma coactivator 1-alpha-like [Centruroides sculpturatus]